MVLGHPDELVQDRHYLWKDFKNRKFIRPYMHGVVGPQWRIPIAESSDGFKHISSPMPVPQFRRRLHAFEFPPTTLSPTSFDMPMRKDVIQANIPTATIRTVEESIDPRFPPKKPVPVVAGTLYHGTGSVDPNVVHGLPPEQIVVPVTTFVEKNSKNLKKVEKVEKTEKAEKIEKVENVKQPHHENVDAMKEKKEALAHAKSGDDKVTHVMYSVTDRPYGGPEMILGVDMLNKYENPDIRIHQHNAELAERLRRVRNTPAGVRAAHTLRKLPPEMI